jgi:uncharacterized membrane protein HdeD (DUF308 family)
LALAIAPFVFGYTNHTYALWASIVLGVVALATSAYKIFMNAESNWEGWIIGVTGILAIAAPFVFGFSTLVAAMWAFIVIGAILFLLAVYELFYHLPGPEKRAGSKA